MKFEDCRVVGMHFRGQSAKDIAAALKPGDTVELEAEPDNLYDANAIKVLVSEIFIGYVEAQKAVWISTSLEEGQTLSGVVTDSVEIKNNIHPIITVEIEG